MDKGVASLSEGDTDSDGDNDTQYAFLLPLIEKNDLNEVFRMRIPMIPLVETEIEYGTGAKDPCCVFAASLSSIR